VKSKGRLYYEAVKLNYLLGLHVQCRITVISYGVGYLTRVAGETLIFMKTAIQCFVHPMKYLIKRCRFLQKAFGLFSKKRIFNIAFIYCAESSNNVVQCDFLMLLDIRYFMETVEKKV